MGTNYLAEGAPVTEASGAKRNKIEARFDLICWDFMPQVLNCGSYPDFFTSIEDYKKNNDPSYLIASAALVRDLYCAKNNKFSFLTDVAHILYVGAEKYGDKNWQKGLTGVNSGLNHAIKHYFEYEHDYPCDYGERRVHLAQVIVNLMFEWWLTRKKNLEAKITILGRDNSEFA
jgi:Domain of unknown function (DUF5664)